MRSQRKVSKGTQPPDRRSLTQQRATISRRIMRLTAQIKGLKSRMTELDKLLATTSEWPRDHTDPPLKIKQEIKNSSADGMKCKEEVPVQEDDILQRRRSLSDDSIQLVMDNLQDQADGAVRELINHGHDQRHSSFERAARLLNRRRARNENMRDETQQDSSGPGTSNQGQQR